MELSRLARSQMDACVHCGLCLEACPTYRELSIEDDSPRGRIHLVRNLTLGQIEANDRVQAHLDLCLSCRACETACPSGVKYGAIIEDVRARLEPGRKRGLWARTLRRLFFRGLLPHPARLRGLARAIRLSQRTGLDRLARLLPGPLADMAAVARIPDRFGREHLPDFVVAQGHRRFTVAFFTGCVMDVAFGPTNIASVRVLAANGCDVLIPQAQTCCGALQLHAGDRVQAVRQARQTVDLFDATGADYYIINAAGCGSTLKEYHHLLADDPEYAEKAIRFVERVRDITQFLGEIDLVPPTHLVEAEVAYQDACHLAHGQGVRLQPRRLLSQIPGLTLTPLSEPEACCGSAGIYNLVQPEMSMAVLGRKMETVREAGVAVVASANPGCIWQLRLGAYREGLPLEVVHVVDLLDRAYGGEKESGTSPGGAAARDRESSKRRGGHG